MKSHNEHQSVQRMVVVPDDYSEEDKIGYREHCEGLVEMIRLVKSTGSFTIGVYGQWGQGKTSILKQIKKKLDTPVEASDEPVLTVWFNPWQFTGEEHLIIPFFHTLIAGLKKYKEKLKEGKDEKIKSIYNNIKIFLDKLIRVPVALAYGFEGEIKIPLLLSTKFSFDKIIEKSVLQEGEIKAKATPAYEEALDRYESLYYNLMEELQGVAGKCSIKIVLFVDDLDRCLPEKAVKLLEGIKVLLDLKGFVFVIGVAREIIEQGIQVRYRELYRDTRQEISSFRIHYLDKIIQFPFTLPPPDKVRLHSYIKEQMEDLPETAPFMDTILNALGNNPRTLKRFINAISFSLWVADRIKDCQNSEPFKPELLIKMCLIAYQFPRLYIQLDPSPHHLLKIQEFIWSLENKKSHKEIPDEKPQLEKREKTNLPEIDRWLEESSILRKLTDILRKEQRSIDNHKEYDQGFQNKEEVTRYLCMLASTLAPEAITKDLESFPYHPLSDIMVNRMKKIPAGSFLMGEKTMQHEVKLDSYLIDMYPVTQSLYKQVMENNPSYFEGDDSPVEQVTWFDVVKFCNRLSTQVGLEPVYKINDREVEWNQNAKGYRLPTEAEWEYACRARTDGDHYDELKKIAWYNENSKGSSQGVGQLKPNVFGLYDMLGNVWEWVWDFYDKYPSKKVTITNPTGPSVGSFRVLRGGSWNDYAAGCRAASRDYCPPGYRLDGIGFRLSRSLP